MNNSTEEQRAHVYIHGDVIGVGFRSWTVRNARELGLTGWVKNAGRGLVEAVFEGKKEKVEEMVSSCRRGPEVAWVEKVDVSWEHATKEFTSFEVVF